MKLQLNQDLKTPKGRLLKDSIIEVATDENLIPLDQFWRNRLTDSVVDNCVEVFKENQSKTKK